MEIWDKLCTMLRARKVSVEDVSNKVAHLPTPILQAFLRISRRRQSKLEEQPSPPSGEGRLIERDADKQMLS